MAAKQKPRYDGTWRPEPGKALPPVPEGVQPVLRFRNPLGGSVAWDDKVKGRIEISNDELDDLVIARPDGTPTYNFCVVVDDIDMHITHVIRGDDHVNNTPRQINIFRALGQEPPVYRAPAHRAQRAGREDEQAPWRQAGDAVPRRRATWPMRWSTTSRGWAGATATTRSSRASSSCSGSTSTTWAAAPAQFDEAKLRWVNAQHMKTTPTRRSRSWWRRSCASAASTRRRRALPRDLRAVQGPLRHHGGAGRLGCSVLRRRAAEPEDVATHVTDGGAAGDRHAGEQLESVAGPRRRSARRSRRAARARPEDAAARDAGARAGDAARRRRRRSMLCWSCSLARQCSTALRRA